METVQDLMNFILWDRRLVLLPDSRVVFILNPTVADKNFAMLEKHVVMQQAIASETPTEKQLFDHAREGGLWTDQDDLVLKEAEGHIAFLESEKNRHKLVSKKVRLEKQIEETREKLQDVLNKKQYMYILTADYMANEAYVLELMKRTIVNLDGTSFFNDSNKISLFKESNLDLMNFLIKETMSEGALSQAEIRKVAKSLEWRMLWTLNKENTQTIFGVPVYNLSSNQRMLIYWSRVYDMAYESTEKPDEDIIQDDAQFDIWLQNRNNTKKEDEISKKRNMQDHHERGVILDGYYVSECTCGVLEVKVRGHGERPRHADTCFYGTYRKYTKEEKDKIADEIYARNPKKIQLLQTQEQMTVSKVGMIDEKDLRKRNSRLLLGSKQEVHTVRK